MIREDFADPNATPPLLTTGQSEDAHSVKQDNGLTTPASNARIAPQTASNATISPIIKLINAQVAMMAQFLTLQESFVFPSVVLTNIMIGS